MTARSRERGGIGERGAIAALAERGIVARRTGSQQAGQSRFVQSRGLVPDLDCAAPWEHLWVEVKWTKSPREIWTGIHQAGEGTMQEGERRTLPLVLYRGDGKRGYPAPWIAVLPWSMVEGRVGMVGARESSVGDGVDLLRNPKLSPDLTVLVTRKACPQIVLRQLATLPLSWLAPLAQSPEGS